MEAEGRTIKKGERYMADTKEQERKEIWGRNRRTARGETYSGKERSERREWHA